MNVPFDEIQKLIRSKAWKLLKQCKAAGCHSYAYEDIEQELWCAYCKARDKYSDEFGVPFMAYLSIGLNKFIAGFRQRKVFDRIEEEWAASLSRPMGDDSDATFGDILPSADPTPDAIAEENSSYAFAQRQLSSRARLFIRILQEQPAELLDAIKQAETRGEWARQLGVKHMHYSQVTTGAIFKVMDASRIERTSILAEVREVGRLMEAA